MRNKTPEKEEEPAFRVTDRRRVGREGPPEEAAARETSPERPSDPPPTTEEQAPPTADQEGPGRAVQIGTADLVRIFIAELHMRALIHMGLIPNPATRLVSKDLPGARLAIDCVAALIEQVSPSAEPAERDELHQMLTSLRLHFVRQSGG